MLRMPEATPSRSRGAAPMIALLLGELKIAIPIATGSMRSIKPNGIVSTWMVDMRR